MTRMTIARLAEAGDVGVDTVRYYQRRRLLAEPERPGGGGFRSYGDEDVRRLRFIRQAQTAGFTLDEIGELLALNLVEDRARARQMAGVRIAALDAKIDEMQAARSALAKLIDDCSAGSSGSCPIIEAFGR